MNHPPPPTTPSPDRAGTSSTPSPRVVSLIPSGTEIVAALGFADHLVGVSHCCDHPPSVRGLPVLSESKVDPAGPGQDIDRGVRELIRDGLSVYRVREDAFQAARPDVVVTQDHCEACAVSLSDVEEAVRGFGLPGTRVCSLNPHDLGAVEDDFRAVAAALRVPERGGALVRDFRRRIERVRALAEGVPRVRVALVEWLHPPMVAGGWMPELAWAAGAEPLLVQEPGAFLEIGWQTLADADPDVVILLPCGFDVGRTLDEIDRDPGLRRAFATVPALCRGDAWVVDGDAYFNRPGPRLADSAELLLAILHPERAERTLAEFGGAALRLPAMESALGA
jgi:iron complex transport system substrate-binding protein